MYIWGKLGEQSSCNNHVIFIWHVTFFLEAVHAFSSFKSTYRIRLKLTWRLRGKNSCGMNVMVISWHVQPISVQGSDAVSMLSYRICQPIVVLIASVGLTDCNTEELVSYNVSRFLVNHAMLSVAVVDITWANSWLRESQSMVEVRKQTSSNNFYNNVSSEKSSSSGVSFQSIWIDMRISGEPHYSNCFEMDQN